MSKIIVPLHFQEQFATPTSVGPGVKKFYLRNQWFKIYDGISESDLVLERPLDNFTPSPGTITSNDTVLSAIEKLDYSLQNIPSSTIWGSILGTVTNQLDLIAYLNANYTPSSRTITINGVTYDLTANRTWTINSGTWGNITGTITNQLDLIAYLSNNYYPLLSNPAGYLTQEQVVEYPDLASFPPTGVVGTIYVALDTDLAYVWDTNTLSYVLTSLPDTGITGIGKTNRVAKFNSPTNLVWSKISEDQFGGVKIADSNRSFLNGNSVLSIQRAQNQLDFVMGNSNVSQPTSIISDNTGGGLEINSKGILSLKAGSTYLEGIRILTSGKLQITQTPDTGTTSDLVLVRDSSGNVKTVAYPVATGFVPYTGATQDVDLGEYELKAGQIEFDQSPTGTAGTGIMRWNDQDGTVDLGLKGGNVTLQIGQEEVIRVVNKTGINLLESNYQVTRIRTVAEGGAQGQRLAVVLAQANTKANHTGVLGIVTENINNNQEGFITTFGMVRNIDTTGSLQGETWVDGDVLWLSDTVAGGLTNIEPTTHPVQIGYVVYAHNNNGKIFVKVSEGVDELEELHDVNISSPTDNQVLAYTSSTQLWENKNVNTVIGYTPLPTQAGSTTGTVVTFVTDRVYGTIASPETGNITADVTGAQIGVTNIIIHNSGTAPTFGVEFKKLSGSGNYVTSQVNYIYCTFINSTEIIYSINQRT